MSQLVITGGDVVLPDRILERHPLVVDGGHIASLDATPTANASRIDATDCWVLPGFVDTHVHGAMGHDVLDGEGAVRRVSQALAAFGVTAFCPTSVACSPADLAAFLTDSQRTIETRDGGARVLGVHLESNFLHPDYAGAQPREWLRTPAEAATLLVLMERHAGAIAIVTIAPELPGSDGLIARLLQLGIRVSLGHSNATCDEARHAFERGVSRVTHLFNRLRPMTHREPGAAGAALASPDVVVELIGDGHHVHPAILRVVYQAVGPSRVIAISDGTAGSGLPKGSRTVLGGRPVEVGEVARLEDGTLAGSVTSMDRVFAFWAETVGVPLIDAAHVCATSPANSLGRTDLGRIAPGAQADLVVMARDFTVRRTIVGGRQVFPTAENRA